jgi:hypothetical protein
MLAYVALNSCETDSTGQGVRCPNGELRVKRPFTIRRLHIGVRRGEVRQVSFSKRRDIFEGVSSSGNDFTIIQPTSAVDATATYTCQTHQGSAGCLAGRW